MRIHLGKVSNIDYNFGKCVEIAIKEIKHFEDSIDRIPVAILAVYDHTTETFGDDVGYLSPFRGYAFQVSASFKGDGDCGATPVFGLRNVTQAIKPERKSDFGYSSNLYWETTRKELLEGMALMAIQKFCDKRVEDDDGNWYRFSFCDIGAYNEDGKRDRVLPNNRITNEWFPTKLDRFIYETAYWIDKNFYMEITAESKND